ncbi:OPT oligopeptide transporter protein-domain-containing protein [Mycena sp. CBHHK59/15]|nr:OPT oligopeptide transporter protein-domain-containing protein [Mycena sp. CBHHK59/15]
MAFTPSEFTPSAVVIGLLIGCLLCFANLSMSLQSALIGFLISRLLPIIVVQTTAVATGVRGSFARISFESLNRQNQTMPLAAGFVGIIPALKLLDEARDGSPPINLTWIAAIGWSCSIAFFGVFLSPPIRKQVIINEQLAFPSGMATAQLIAVLHQMPPPDTTIRQRVGYIAVDVEDTDADRSEDLINADEPSAPETVQSEGWHALTSSFVASAQQWLWTFTPSLAYVGQGFPTTLSMSLGMLIGWGVLSPLAKLSGWAPGPVGDMTDGARGWILWTSLAIMCADSLISLLPVIAEYIIDVLPRHGSPAPVKQDHDIETDDRLVPNTWVIGGLLVSVAVGTVLGCVTNACYTIPNTSNRDRRNIIAGGVAEAGAQQRDICAERRLAHNSFGQLVGSAVSILVTTTAYTLYNRAYVIPGPSFPAPTAYVWLSLARLLRDGELPEQTSIFMIGFAALFALISALKTFTARRQLWFTQWIPSGVAFAIGFLNTPSFTIARLIGGIVEHLYRTRYARGKSDIRLIVIASGFVLGEGVVSVVALVLRTFGVGSVSCWGCIPGLCGGCSA